MNEPSKMAPATPAALARPTTGAMAKATLPEARPMSPTQSAKPMAAETGISSPSSATPKTAEATRVAMARKIIDTAMAVTWAASFSRAMRRLPSGATATMSRLPRLASPASVPDKARIDQRPARNAKNGPYL
jgi:hypothetical protein